MSNSEGLAQFSLPSFIQNSLNYLEIFQNVRNQKYNQRISVADILKVEGNLSFKSGNFRKATQDYERVTFYSIFFSYITEKYSYFSIILSRISIS